MNQPVTLTNVLTDLDRQFTVNGDGLILPAGLGVWEATTNAIPNPDAEPTLSGIAAIGSGTVAGDTSIFKFGSQSVRATTPGSIAQEGMGSGNSGGGTAATGQTWTGSAWIFSRAGGEAVSVQIVERDVNGSFLASSQTDVVLSAGWQRVSVTRSFTNASTSQLNVRVVTTGTSAVQFWVDGIQAEQKPYATPWVNGSRAVGQVEVPFSLIDVNQGWFAARVRPNFGSGGIPTGNPRIFSTGTFGNEWLGAYFYQVTNGITMERRHAGASDLARLNTTWNAGDGLIVVGTWDASAIRVSLNGSAWTTAVVTAGRIPTGLSHLYLGSEPSSQALDGELEWVALGTGALSDTEKNALATVSKGASPRAYIAGTAQLTGVLPNWGVGDITPPVTI